jgi:ribosomal protein S18 acetylase RimI-like enzyme
VEDLPFLKSVYASTRADELALTGWDEAQKDAFIQIQFEAQHRYYHDQFPDADYAIVSAHGRDIGRWYVAREPDVFRVLDVALLPQWRGAGYGTALMESLLADAAHNGRCIELHVEANNRALHWYRRLGFEEIEVVGIYLRMRRGASPETLTVAEQASAA